VTTEPAVKALEWYANLLRNYAPPGVENWNWPDIADAFGQGTVAIYIDAHSSAGVINDPQKSKVIGKIGYARWPKGPAGKRVTSIWNWSFPVNAALSERKKKATWLFIQWATSRETQIATSYGFSGAYKRTGANRTSLWQDAQYRKVMEGFGDNLVDVDHGVVPRGYRCRMASAHLTMASGGRDPSDGGAGCAGRPGHAQRCACRGAAQN
jgi:multiple sugar transport system substrate-binding protein